MATPAVWRSKLNTVYNKQEIEASDAKLKTQLRALKQQPENKRCFDCGADDVSWASPKLGVFICVACSDVHRAAGAHITCVKNFNTYLWGPDEVALMTAVGNKRGQELYGSEMISPNVDKNAKVAFCTRKYGGPQIQGLVEKTIVEAKASAAKGGESTTQVQAPQVSASQNCFPVQRSNEGKSIHEKVAVAKAGAVSTGVQKPRNVSPLESATDLLDDLFPQTSEKPLLQGYGCPRDSALRVDTEQNELEDFLFKCNDAGNTQSHATPKSPVDLFAGWESWS